MKDIVNIVICYSNENEVIAYANALSEQTVANNITLVIVINRKGNYDFYKFKNKLDEINLEILVYNPNENLGYMNGLIYGYKLYSDKNENVPIWVVMCNTDIEFTDTKFFESFSKNSYDDEIWCVAPSIYSPSKRSYENPQYINRYTIHDLNRRINIFKRPNLAYIYIKLAKIKAIFLKKSKKKSQHVYSAHGCFFIIRGAYAEILKYKKYKALMYSEEAFIAENILVCGKKCYYDSSIEVFHNESSVTGKLDNNKKAEYLADSLIAIRDEFFIK